MTPDPATMAPNPLRELLVLTVVTSCNVCPTAPTVKKMTVRDHLSTLSVHNRTQQKFSGDPGSSSTRPGDLKKNFAVGWVLSSSQSRCRRHRPAAAAVGETLHSGVETDASQKFGKTGVVTG